MGRGTEMPPVRHLSAQKLTPNTDKFKYPKAVRMGAHHVRVSANGWPGSSRRMASGLRYNLYAAMEYSFQQVVDHSLNPGELKLSHDDDTPLTTAEQRGALEELLSTVLKDYATDGLRRLVSMNKDVYTCRRGADERSQLFAETFRGHAQNYHIHFHSSHAMQDTENFAMIVLENAKLPTSTFNNIGSLLVSGAKEGNKENVTNYEVHEEKLIILQNHMEKLKADWEAYQLLSQLVTESTEGGTIRMTSINTTLNDHMEELHKIKKRTESTLGRDRTQYIVHLDDTVTALNDIKSDFGKHSKSSYFHKADTISPVKDTRPPK